MMLQGDARRIPLADESVQCVVTSPPYFGLRSYGIGTENGEIGLEETPEAYVANLVEVFREVRRVLRDDGTVWLNLGSSYATSGTPGYKAKDLIPIPWLVALALQADEWWLRSDIIWSKSNCMPSSVRDRPTTSHEYVFLLSKSARYFYDQEAVREPCTVDYGNTEAYRRRIGNARYHDGNSDPKGGGWRGDGGWQKQTLPSGRNRRTVWTISTKSYRGAHFATFPPALVEPCVLAGTSPKGACPKCGAPWERITKLGKVTATGGSATGERATNMETVSVLRQKVSTAYNTGAMKAHEHITLGFRPTCSCEPHNGDGPLQPRPCVVLDPFAGSGTVGLVCAQHGRDFVGIELNPDYIALAQERLGEAVQMVAPMMG